LSIIINYFIHIDIHIFGSCGVKKLIKNNINIVSKMNKKSQAIHKSNLYDILCLDKKVYMIKQSHDNGTLLHDVCML
jgi:hypothetical protein